jgi:hypothetical protein
VIYRFIVGLLTIAVYAAVFVFIIAVRVIFSVFDRSPSAEGEPSNHGLQQASAEMQHHERDGYNRWLQERSKEP